MSIAVARYIISIIIQHLLPRCNVPLIVLSYSIEREEIHPSRDIHAAAFLTDTLL